MLNESKAKEWAPGVKKFLVNLKLKDLIEKSNDILKVRPETINYIKKEISKDWDVASIQKKNNVAGYFAKYVNAMIEVYAQKKEAQPLIDKLEVMKKNLADAEGKLNEKNEQLNIVKAKV